MVAMSIEGLEMFSPFTPRDSLLFLRLGSFRWKPDSIVIVFD